jgi:acyl-coenzyme A synthetase/AMP-(fatty) acid ligase
MVAAAIALIELDGFARRIVLCPPDLADSDLPDVVAIAGVEAVAFDESTPALKALDLIEAPQELTFQPLAPDWAADAATEWLMFTSGTTGTPKMVIHSLEGLTGAIKPSAPNAPTPVWGTFYDIRRYGGLQILLRALLGEGSLVLSGPDEPFAVFISRLARLGVTHLTGTPSHWRRLLMSPPEATLNPTYVRLSGEIADQDLLDGLRARFPAAAIGHAFASTEAGVGFEVTDGLEGFPAGFVDKTDGEVEMRVAEGSLRLRSSRAASAYVNADAPPLADAEGFVDTGDMVERSGDRWRFVGRRGGIINVGGLKVHPEEVEAVISRHPAVRAALVRGRRNPITGSIVVADVVLETYARSDDEGRLRAEILAVCRQTLAAHKAPASVRFVPELAMTAGGKLERPGA